MAIKTKPVRKTKPNAQKIVKRALASQSAGSPGAVRDTAAKDGDMRQLTHAELVNSRLNPRKTFDAGSVSELAASIRAQGAVLQNLVARPHPSRKGIFELAAGERRWRAVAELVAAGDWPADRPLPVLVVALTDLELLELATAENVQRQPLSPMEEARAYAAMRDMKLGTEDIAARAGMSQRHVQERIALVEKLAPQAQAALEAGEISIAQARMLKLGEAKEQAVLLGDIKRGFYGSPEAIRNQMVGGLPRVATAHFSLELYDGAYVEDPDGDEAERRFADKAKFMELQSAAIEATRAKLADKWAWVEVHENYFSDYDYGRSKDRKLAGAVIVVHARRGVEVKTGYVKPKAAKAAAGGAKPKPDFTQKHLVEAHRLKSAALQRAVAGDLRMAKVMTCFALVSSYQSVVKISANHMGNDERALDLHVSAGLDRLRRALGVSLFNKIGTNDAALLVDHGVEDKAAVYRAIRALADADLDALFAALVASRVGSFTAYHLGDDPVAVALAEDLGVDMGQALPLPEAYLKLAGKERLVELLEVKGACDKAARAQLMNKTAGTLRAMVMHEAANVLPRELQFGTSEDLARAEPIAGDPRQLDLEEACARADHRSDPGAAAAAPAEAAE